MQLSFNIELNLYKLRLKAFLGFGILSRVVLQLRTAEKLIASVRGSASSNRRQQVLSKQCHLFNKTQVYLQHKRKIAFSHLPKTTQIYVSGP